MYVFTALDIPAPVYIFSGKPCYSYTTLVKEYQYGKKKCGCPTARKIETFSQNKEAIGNKVGHAEGKTGKKERPLDSGMRRTDHEIVHFSRERAFVIAYARTA